ncbi:UNVERIFIED_CONTAM: hypothetical protein GTU68_018382, partial [Idotea baltica]|nr:hypothetical protein [Idotea baltica]
VLLLSLLSVTFALPAPSGSEENYGDQHSGSHEGSYEFTYNVHDSSDELDFGHHETKSDDRVEGYYYVLLPDSRLQRVNYYVDGYSGFVAEVAYEGSAEFDDHYGSS